MKVLVVEDDPRIGATLQKLFTESGEFCRWARDGGEGLALARGQEYEILVLDILLPIVDGLEIVRTMRKEGILTPVLLLTALGHVAERVAGLEAGADDYLVKPFECAELLARVRALKRRSHARPMPIIEVGDVVLDLSARVVTRGGARIELTPTETRLLDLLMRHGGQLLTRKMIGMHLWNDDWDISTNVVDVHINRLRAKLDRGFDDSLIHTVRGRGYVFRAA